MSSWLCIRSALAGGQLGRTARHCDVAGDGSGTQAGLEEEVELVERGVAELDWEAAASYDAVTSGLCFSELNDDEVAWREVKAGPQDQVS